MKLLSRIKKSKKTILILLVMSTLVLTGTGVTLFAQENARAEATQEAYNAIVVNDELVKDMTQEEKQEHIHLDELRRSYLETKDVNGLKDLKIKFEAFEAKVQARIQHDRLEAQKKAEAEAKTKQEQKAQREQTQQPAYNDNTESSYGSTYQDDTYPSYDTSSTPKPTPPDGGNDSSNGSDDLDNWRPDWEAGCSEWGNCWGDWD